LALRQIPGSQLAENLRETLNTQPRCIFITGATGYLGRPLIATLVARGHQVKALVRPGSQSRLPSGCEVIEGNALDATSYAAQIHPADTFVQLVGVPHPNPSKADEFRRVDLASAKGAIHAAAESSIHHFIYLSVAQPAPVMKAYIQVRAECESLLRESGMNATILRPWYVLGPGHRWPYALIPMYWLMELLPATREGALRLGLVTLNQMVGALAAATENPGTGVRIIEVPGIRANRGSSTMGLPR
jgi:uncharacterized protein YbjT (DUF2867 family)